MRMAVPGIARLRRGTALVEMAIVLLLLMLLTLGAIEYGWMFLKQEQITNAARQASRLACTPDATNAQVTTQISRLMSSYGMASSGYTTTLTPNDVSAAGRGETVTVQISVTYKKVGITNFALLPMPAKLSSAVVMEKEGP
ncbi:MAG: TadE family protein [Phycisphaerales bacterium]|nr:TadE family protein [Phycisphaerales bacterium]